MLKLFIILLILFSPIRVDAEIINAKECVIPDVIPSGIRLDQRQSAGLRIYSLDPMVDMPAFNQTENFFVVIQKDTAYIFPLVQVEGIDYACGTVTVPIKVWDRFLAFLNGERL